MFTKHETTDTSVQEIGDIIKRKLTDDGIDADEFSKLLDQYTRLILAKTAEKQSAKVSPDVKATILANLVGIGLIINHERAHVVASKALSFVMKLR